MKFQAAITVEFEAEDVHDERHHKARLEATLAQLSEAYASASLVIRGRRPRLKPRARAPERLDGSVEIVRALYVS